MWVSGVCLQRPRIAGAEEPAIAGGPTRCSPTSSWCALETPAAQTRRGDGRRLSGEHRGGSGTIGEDVVRQPPQPAFFYARPGPTGTQTRKGVFNKFRRGAMRSCRARVDPEARRMSASSRLRQSPVQPVGGGTGVAILDTELGRRDPPPPRTVEFGKSDHIT